MKKQITIYILLFLGVYCNAQMGTPCATLPIVNVPVVGSSTDGPCGSSVPHFIVDLSSNPDSTWISPDTVRFADVNDACNTCCSANVLPPDNERCISFEVTLNPDAAGIRFFIAGGAAPGGSLGWRLMNIGGGVCENEAPADMDIYLSGPGPHYISFCKPGTNPNTYGITSIRPRAIYDSSCFITVQDMYPGTTTVNSIAPGAYGTFNSYLSCTSGCDSIYVNTDSFAPDTIFYEVCGIINDVNANPITICDTVMYIDKKIVINVPTTDPIFCTPSDCVVVNANIKGASGVQWSSMGDGIFLPNSTVLNPLYLAGTSDLSVGTAVLYATTSGNGTCAPKTDSLLLFFGNSMANAGADQVVCANNITINLSGSIQGAMGGIWSTTGTGSFSPNNTTLNAIYIPSASDIANGVVDILLTTTGNGACNGSTDTMQVTITPAPTVDAGLDQLVYGISCVPLNGAATVATGVMWSTSGTGTFSPNAVTFNACYMLSPSDTAAGSVCNFLTTTGNGNCMPVSDTMCIIAIPTMYTNVLLSGCDSVVYGSNVYTASTSFYDTLLSVGGYDSVIANVNITVNSIISGNVFYQGNPVTGGNVQLIEKLGNTPNDLTVIDQVAIQSNGSYAFNSAGNSNYIVLADVDTTLYPGSVPTYYDSSINWLSAVEIDVVNCGDTATGKNIYLVDFTGGTGGPASIRGQIINSGDKSGGAGISNVNVYAFEVTGNGKGHDVTNSTGQFIITDLDTGYYLLEADVFGYISDTAIQVLLTETVAEVDVEICLDSVDLEVVICMISSSSIQQYQHLNVRIYPNPFSNHTTIELGNIKGKIDLRLVDQLGKEIWKETTTQSQVNINREELPDGIYYLTVNDGKQSNTYKLIIK